MAELTHPNVNVQLVSMMMDQLLDAKNVMANVLVVIYPDVLLAHQPEFNHLHHVLVNLTSLNLKEFANNATIDVQLVKTL